MDLALQSALLAALVSALLAIVVALRATERRQATHFAVLAGNLALWLLADFLYGLTERDLFLRAMIFIGGVLPLTA
ncbi:MAG: hypothetical protein D6729_15135, partial [Deltaproteobacteria bacterium]